MFDLWYYLDFEELFKIRYEDILLILNRADEPEFTKFLYIYTTSFWLQLLQTYKFDFFCFLERR